MFTKQDKALQQALPYGWEDLNIPRGSPVTTAWLFQGQFLPKRLPVHTHLSSSPGRFCRSGNDTAAGHPLPPGARPWQGPVPGRPGPSILGGAPSLAGPARPSSALGDRHHLLHRRLVASSPP